VSIYVFLRVSVYVCVVLACVFYVRVCVMFAYVRMTAHVCVECVSP
jgi:hypothetical protein